MPTTFTFQKKVGAPAGVLTFDITPVQFFLDDGANTTYVTNDPAIASELGQHPYLRLVGTSGTVTAPPVVQQLYSVDGVVSASDGFGGYVPVTITATAGGIRYLGPWSAGTTYAQNDAALASDGNWYVSFASGNIGHNPVGDALVHWGPTNGLNAATIAPGTAGRDKVVVSPAGVGDRDVVSAADSPWLIVPDAATIPFTSVSGTTLSSTSAAASHQGKTICIPGAGRDDGFGVKDAWTTTVTGVTPGNSLTLANSVPTAVSTGSNRNAAIGTDWTTQLNSFSTAVGTSGAKSIMPVGNIMHTGTINYQPGLVQNKGLPIEGQGSGAPTPTATAGTSFWFVGPVAGGGNGAGIPAMQAADTGERAGLKLKHFSIQCLRPMDVSTTVVGAGQVISTTPISLTVAATAGMAAKGRINIVGGVEAQYTSIVDATHLGGVQVVSGTYTTVGGEIVRTINAAVYWDFLRLSELHDVYVAGYQDNNAVFSNANQGRVGWFNNLSSGFCKVSHLTGRYFKGANESIRVGAANTGYGIRGNGGNTRFDTIVSYDCSSGIWCQSEAGSPIDGNTFSTIKILGPAGTGTMLDGSTSFALKVDGGWQGNTFDGIHSEGCYNTITCAGHGNTFTGIFSSFQSAAAGGADGSALVQFTGSAQGNIVERANPQGWTTGVPGAPTGTKGFSYAAVFGSNTTGNRVTARPVTNFTVYGIGPANYNGTTGNILVDLTAAALAGDAGSGQQAGIIAPDDHLPGGGASITFVANQAYFARFVPTRPIACIKIGFNISTTAGSNDNLDVGIYQVSGSSIVRVASTGSTAGKANLGGVTTINVTANLLPGVTYYAAIAYGTIGTTAAVIQGKFYNSASNAGIFGTGVGTSVSGTLAASFPLPAGPISPAWNAANIPTLAIREA